MKNFLWTGILFYFSFCVEAKENYVPDFNHEIRPILSDRCFKCHSTEDHKGDLRLDKREFALDVIDLKDIKNSEFYYRIMTDDHDDIMPPPEKAKSLSAREKELLVKWMEHGANYEKHWAYNKPVNSKLPTVKNKKWTQTNAIDVFIQKKLEEKNLKPNVEAEPAVLIRRLYFDLVGLPPSVEVVNAFEVDPSDKNYQSIVDQLLSSNHYGEKWALHWLDLARYADSNGYQHDDLRNMWPYRNWVINAFNSDMPFDQFTIDQLAGDLVKNSTHAQKVATGFHQNVATNFSGGTKVDEVRANTLHDRVSTTGQVWLGMTMECCQCHDHKFDPITQADYYKMYAYFNQSIPEVDVEGPGMFKKKYIGAEIPSVASEADRKRVQDVNDEIQRIKKELEKSKPLALAEQEKWEREFLASGRLQTIPWARFPWNLRNGGRMIKISPEKRTPNQEVSVRALLFYDHPVTGQHEKAIDRLKEERHKLAPKSMVMKDSKKYVKTHVFKRGDYTSLGELIEPGVPSVLHPKDNHEPQNRLGLARWIVNPENPLTARVTVNRFWAQIFGQGIVTTIEDFGLQSTSPTHPELLDWLALEFMQKNWSMKKIIRTIVMSSTYRQSSAVTQSSYDKDPSNQWLSRGPRFRLPAELIRDNLLSISGQLSLKIGGPSVFPEQPQGLWKEISGADVTFYPTSIGEDQYRRGLYTFLRRGNPNPMLLNFDGSNRSACILKRSRSNTPVQALNLLNDPTYVEAARALALSIENIKGDRRTKIIYAFKQALARTPDDSEVNRLVDLFNKHKNWFSVAQVLLNLDETITKS